MDTSMLDEAGVAYELLSHAHTETAEAEAEALGVPPETVGKTLVVTTPEGNARVVLPASERLDLRKLADLLGVGHKRVHLAGEDALARDYSDFELGAVPPFGGPADAVFVDARLAEHDQVVVEAGTHDASLRLGVSDLVRATDARVADLCRDYERTS